MLMAKVGETSDKRTTGKGPAGMASCQPGEAKLTLT